MSIEGNKVRDRLIYAGVSELEHRANTVESDMRRWQGTELKPKTGVISTVEENIKHTAFWHIREMDMLISTMIADAKFNEVFEKTGDAALAAQAANAQVQAAMPTHSIMEMPSFLADKHGAGYMLIFHGYYSKLWQMSHEKGHEMLRVPYLEGKDVDAGRMPLAWAAAKWAGRSMAMLTFASVMGHYFLGHGREPDEDWQTWYIRRALASPFTMVPYLSYVAQPLADLAVTGHFRAPNPLQAPGLAYLYKAVGTLGTMTSHKRPDDNKILAAVELMLMMRGLPSRAPVRAAQYVTDVAKGKISPRGPFDFAGGLMYGQKAAAKYQEETPLTTLQNLFSESR
jgi:hypothetical protein